MADPNPINFQPSEFTQLPLAHIIGDPLDAVIQAQALSANSTVKFIKSLIDDKGNPICVNFNATTKQVVPSSTPGTAPITRDATTSIQAPLLSIVPIPHIRIDLLNIHFKYSITQVASHDSTSSDSLSGNIQASWPASAFISGGISGSVSSTTHDNQSTTRNGELEITVHASEAPIPEGLAKILSILANSISTPPAATSSSTTTPAQG